MATDGYERSGGPTERIMTRIDFEQHLRDFFPFGLPISRACGDRLNLRELVASASGPANFSGSYLVRRLAARYNQHCDEVSTTLKPLSSGELITVATIVELMRYVAYAYCHDQNPGATTRGLQWIATSKSLLDVDRGLPIFVEFFPARAVVVDEIGAKEFIRGTSAYAPHSELVAEEEILLLLANINPAFRPFREFFADDELSRATTYRQLVAALGEFFDGQPPVRELDLPLLKVLMAPIENSPDSLEGQLEFIRRYWSRILPASLIERIITARDILREEHFGRGFSQGSLEVLRFGHGLDSDYGYPEPEDFSQDADWMSNVVLIAKSTYVWLDQLSKKYRRHVRYLSDIPDEELDQLARWGFNGLWLIGLWERSTASQKIKQMMGNPEALSSAYSLFDYTVASDLGGESAYENLRQRAARRGIRLASDMVPNHTGIYSRWVIEHPDWFVHSPYPPFPVYRYSGHDLSDDGRVVIQIEDGYWEHRDAAVVFKRYDRDSGDTRYIYHGNDGTNMPWNDTAQLNFLLTEVREAVIQTILHVARMFPIIRFDAAMTLAKKHYQRLWFPKPGEGGAIPSRAECGMTREDFDRAMPKEFWREVVDRIRAEAPETLLLAEAFWLMEGYFVRTLGMHRVYNSAFMNMLKMEENSKYRQTIKNVLEFSPEVAKRFVNFMNNPDERTAIEQFGKGDKYIGVALMMVTMPGLPMFGHGQIEGFSEKYGMEYRRAYWDEPVDHDLVRRHEHEVFPLMRRRRLFSGASNFALYDFFTTQGWVDENVFAYSNRVDDERALILYNNAYNSAAGWVKTSTAINVGAAETPYLVQRNLTEALGLKSGEHDLYVFRDHRSNQWFIRSGRDLSEQGMFAMLGGYQYHAFLDWREVHDHDGSWRELMRRLHGGGVNDIEVAHRELRLEPILTPLRELLSVARWRALHEDETPERRHDLELAKTRLYAAACRFIGGRMLKQVEAFEFLSKLTPIAGSDDAQRATAESSTSGRALDAGHNDIVLVWSLLHPIGEWHESDPAPAAELLWQERLDAWQVRSTLTEFFSNLTDNEQEGAESSLLCAALLTTTNPFFDDEFRPSVWFAPGYTAQYLGVNVYEGVRWFNKERWESFVGALANAARYELALGNQLDEQTRSAIAKREKLLVQLAASSAYRVDDTAAALAQILIQDRDNLQTSP